MTLTPLEQIKYKLYDLLGFSGTSAFYTREAACQPMTPTPACDAANQKLALAVAGAEQRLKLIGVGALALTIGIIAYKRSK